MKPSKQTERAVYALRELHKFRDKLRDKLPSLRRLELDMEFENGKLTERVKVETK